MARVKEKSVSQILQDLIKSEILKVHTSIPAKITNINFTKGTVDAIPVTRKYVVGEKKYIDAPVIPDIPVQFPRTSDAVIATPIKVGDTGAIHFCERSIEAWQKNGGVLAPYDFRHHNLTDGIFVPGLLSDGQGPPLSGDKIQIKYKTAELTIDGSGNIVLKGSDITVDGPLAVTGAVDAQTEVDTPEYKVGGTAGVTGAFVSADGKAVVVTKGIITAITPL